MNRGFLFSFFRKLFRGKKREIEERIENREKESERSIGEYAAALTEELNFRLICFQLGETAEEEDALLAELLKGAGMCPVWNFLTEPQDFLWVERVTVAEIIYPVKEKSRVRFIDRVMCFITNKKTKERR